MKTFRHRLRGLRRPALVLLCLMLTAVARPAAAAIELPPGQAMYAIYGNFLQDHYLFRVDLSTGVAKQIGNTHSRGISSLTADNAGKLYSWSGESGLITIDRKTAAITDINPLIGAGGITFESLDFAPNGKLYGWGSGLYEINPTTGAKTFVAGTGFPPGTNPTQLGGISGIEFVGDRLLGVAWSSVAPGCLMMEIPLSDAPSTHIGFTGTTLLSSLAGDANGKLYSIQHRAVTNLLVTLDPTSGATTDSLLITPDVVRTAYKPFALAIVAVPEPSLGALLALVPVVRKRKR